MKTSQQSTLTMARSPAARARRKQARKSYLEDSSSDESSDTSSRENVSLSRRKKRAISARACAMTARKVSIDNDDENPQKKDSDPISTLKLNVETNPGMFSFNSFKAFLGLGNQEQNRTPMMANSPVVPPQDLQALYENQVAVPNGATNRLCALFTLFSETLIILKRLILKEHLTPRNTASIGLDVPSTQTASTTIVVIFVP